MLTSILLCMFSFSITALAGTISGYLDAADDTRISGWAWNSADLDETTAVELLIYASGSDTLLETVTVNADSYRADLHDLIGDGYHGFSYSIDWSNFEGTSFLVKAYTMTDEEKLLIGSTKYSKPAETAKTTQQTAAEYGPGVVKTQVSAPVPVQENVKGASLGIFTTTGYCNCSKCSGGHNLTYSGTVPKAEHTISADITLLPLGTKVMIGDTVYTVEDIGSSVDGEKIDIFYSSHEDAWAHGVQQEEVFAVQ